MSEEPRARVEVVERDGERLLLVDGCVQSAAVVPGSTPRGYWSAMMPRRVPRRALILGLGGGTLAHLLRRSYPEVAITGVENSQEVLAVARACLGLSAAGVAVVEADALTYVRSSDRRYDLVLVDLFCGEALPPSVASRAFLRRLRGLVEPGGAIIWNLPRDQRGHAVRRRAEEALGLERRTLAGLNLILHLRRRSRRPL